MINMYVCAVLSIIGAVLATYILGNLIKDAAKIPLAVAIKKIISIIGVLIIGFGLGIVLLSYGATLMGTAPESPTFAAALMTVSAVGLSLFLGAAASLSSAVLTFMLIFDDGWKNNDKYADFVKQHYLRR